MKIRKNENSYNLVCFYPGRAPQKAISKSTIRTVIALANRKHGQSYTIESSTTLFVPCAKKTLKNFVTIWRYLLCLHRCETIPLSLFFNSQFHAKYFASLINQNAKFYSIMRFWDWSMELLKSFDSTRFVCWRILYATVRETLTNLYTVYVTSFMTNSVTKFDRYPIWW